MYLGFALSALVVAGLLFHSWLACTLTGILPGYAGSFYAFTLPHLVLVLTTAAGVAIHALRRTRAAFLFAVIGLTCLLPTWLLAAVLWPGGDDGPGMAWVYGIGPASLLSTVIGLPLVWVAHRCYRRSGSLPQGH